MREVFSSERSANQPKATRVRIRSINQSNRSFRSFVVFVLFARFSFQGFIISDLLVYVVGGCRSQQSL